MIKKSMATLGILCWISPLLAPGIYIPGVDFDRATFLVLFIVGTIALVGAAILNQIQKHQGN